MKLFRNYFLLFAFASALVVPHGSVFANNYSSESSFKIGMAEILAGIASGFGSFILQADHVAISPKDKGLGFRLELDFADDFYYKRACIISAGVAILGACAAGFCRYYNNPKKNTICSHA